MEDECMSELTSRAKGYRLIEDGEYAKGQKIEIADRIEKNGEPLLEIALHALNTQQQGDEVSIRCTEIQTEEGRGCTCEVSRYRPSLFPTSTFKEDMV